MNKGLLLLISALPLLSKCDFLGGEESCNHVDNNPKDHTCDLCGEVLGDHVFGEWSVKTPATYDSTGLEHRVCECGEEETRIIPKLIRTDWDDTQKGIFNNHLYGYKLPYSQDGTVAWNAELQSVIVTGEEVDADGLLAYANKIANDGFTKNSGPYTNTYTLLKDVTYQNKTKSIKIDLYATSENYISVTGIGQLTAVCYDPYLYEWPEDVIETLFDDYFYIAPSVEIPSVSADRYSIDDTYVSSDAILAVYCYSATNIESTYKTALEAKGFTISETKDDLGYYVANESQEIVQVLYQYIAETKALCIVIQQSPGWPSQIVDYYLNQLVSQESSTTIPAVTGANKYEFIDSSWDHHGYFFVLCECDDTLEPAYETALTSAGYTLYNTARNTNNAYAAISEDNDLLVQYSYLVTESIMGGEDYKQFDVMFEPYYPHNEEHLTTLLNLVVAGTETTIPQYPGLGEKLTLSDTNKYIYVTIQSATFSSIAEYVETLRNGGWIIKTENALMGQFLAVSPNRDIQLKTDILDGRIQLTISAFNPDLINWPLIGINEILTDLNLVGEIPEFEGAYGFDYENEENYHDIVCLVGEGDEDTLIEAYYEKLESLEWYKLVDGDYTYYVKNGYTIGLHAYTEYAGEGKVFIDIFYADGTIYDIDGRAAFIDWKFAIGSASDVSLPGINITEEVEKLTLCGDSGETYSGYELFEILVEIENSSKTETIEEIISIFENDGWIYSQDDQLYHKDDMIFTCYQYNDYIVIDVCSPIPEQSFYDVITSFIADCGLTSKVTIPQSLEFADMCTISIDDYSTEQWFLDLYIYITFENSANATTAFNYLLSEFQGAGWVSTYSTTSMVDLSDSSGSLSLYIAKSGSTVEFNFYKF